MPLRKAGSGRFGYIPPEPVLRSVRSGREQTLEITLDEKPQQLPATEAAPQQGENMPSEGDPNEWFEYYRRFFGN